MLSSEFPTAKENHDYEQLEDKLYKCKVCQHTVTRTGSGGTCIGVPIISSWDNMPDFLATKTTLSRDHKKKPHKNQKPAAAKKAYDRKGKFNGHYYPLYLIDEAVPKGHMSEKQRASLEKARYMSEKILIQCCDCKNEIWISDYKVLKVTRKKYLAEQEHYDNYRCQQCKDRHRAIIWAREALQDENARILDTETSDLHGEIIEIAIIDMKGNVILDERIKPEGDIAPKAYEVHGISTDDLKDCPTFESIYSRIRDAIEGKHIIIYNADFDNARLRGDCKRYGLNKIQYQSECAMEAYAAYCGDWSNYHKSYRWQPLNGTHGALGDCIATLERLKEMANT